LYYIKTGRKLEKSTKQLLSDFIANRCSAEEIRQVQELIKAGGHEDEWRKALEEAELQFVEGFQDSKVNEDKIFENIQQVIQAKAQKGSRSSIKWLAVAASLVILGGLGWLFMNKETPKEAPVLVVKSVDKPEPERDTAHRWIKLPDGSSVQLNNDSELDYPESFEGKAIREVTLSGEAYFDIKHDVAHPFVIRTGKIKTTVLGTAFNIRAYQSDQAVTVTVTRGKVKVEDGSKTLAILTPDQQLAWNAKSPEPVKVKVNAAEVVQWKKQDMIMDDITLEEAARLISERYNVKIQFNNDLVKTCRFTAAFLNRNEIGQVLSVISDITGAQLQLKDNLITIDGSGC